MNKLLLLPCLCACIGYTQAQHQTESPEKSVKIWEYFKKECNNSYSYTLEDFAGQQFDLNGHKNSYLDVTVENGKVLRAQHRVVTVIYTPEANDQGYSEQVQIVDSLAKEFAGQKVGTMDDMLAFYLQAHKNKPKSGDPTTTESAMAYGLPIYMGYFKEKNPNGYYDKFEGYYLKQLNLPELERFQRKWKVEAVSDLKNKRLSFPKGERILVFYPDHAGYEGDSTQCYDYYKVDFSAKSIRFNSYDTDFVHYECDNPKDDITEQAYLQATRFEWLPDGGLKLIGKKYIMELSPL